MRPGYTEKSATTLIVEAERVDQSEGDASQTRRDASTAWAAGRDEALAYLARTIPYAEAKVIPPLRVDLLPLQGVMHTVQHSPDLVRVAIVQAGRVPSLLVPGDSETAPLRLAARLEARALATLRNLTDRCCTKLRVARTDIGLNDNFDLGGRSDVNAGRTSYSWRLIMAPRFVPDFVVAREVATIAFAKRDIDSEAFARWLCPDFEKAEAWLEANCRSRRV